MRAGQPKKGRTCSGVVPAVVKPARERPRTGEHEQRAIRDVRFERLARFETARFEHDLIYI